MNRRTWTVIGAALGLALLQFVSYAGLGFLRGPWRIDEAHKLSETVFLRYLLSGDLSSSEWFCSPVERANPPVGKFLLGAGLLAQGVALPQSPSLSATSLGPDHYVPPSFSEETSAPWLYARAAGRATALVAASLTGALIFVILVRVAGWWPGLVGWTVWSTSYITVLYGTTATFDPILTLLIVATALPGLADSSPTLRFSVLTGVFSGLAAATRLTGAISAAAVVATWLVFSRTSRWLRHSAILLAAAVVTLIVVDPFLWAPAQSCLDTHAGNPIARMGVRLSDLRSLSEMLESRGAADWSISRPRFALEYLAGDVPGLLALIPVGASILAVYRNPRLRPLALWAVVMSVGLLLWMPFPWPRYLTTVAAGFAVLAGCGADALRVRRPTDGEGHG